MNDNEIIKALEACKSGYCYCGEGCPLANDDGYDDDISKCTSKLSENALDLINRQRAEIEDLKDINEHLNVFVLEAREAAIKEFAERLKKETLFDSGWGVIQPDVIDNLVKEMTEGTE